MVKSLANEFKVVIYWFISFADITFKFTADQPKQLAKQFQTFVFIFTHIHLSIYVLAQSSRTHVSLFSYSFLT